MAISFSPARVNIGKIKSARGQAGFMTQVLNRVNEERKNNREDARNKILDDFTTQELDIKRSQVAAQEEANKIAAGQTKQKLADQAEQKEKDQLILSGFNPTGLQYYDENDELTDYYLPTLKQTVSGGYKQGDYMSEARLKLGQLLQDIQGSKGKGIKKAISEAPKAWQNLLVGLIDTASQRDNITNSDGDDLGFEYKGFVFDKQFNEKDAFKDLFEAFPMLDTKGVSSYEYALSKFDEIFETQNSMEGEKGIANFSILADKKDPSKMVLRYYGRNEKKPTTVKESDYQAINTADFGRSSKEDAKLSQVLSLAKTTGLIKTLNQDSVDIAHILLRNKELFNLDRLIGNAGAINSTDETLTNLVGSLRFTTQAFNSAELENKQGVGFQGVQPLYLRETNANGILLAVMAEKHMGNQFRREKIKDGLRFTPIKTNNPLSPKNEDYYSLVANNARDTINTTNELFKIQSQIGAIEGGKDFLLGQKILGPSLDILEKGKNVIDKLATGSATLLGMASRSGDTGVERLFGNLEEMTIDGRQVLSTEFLKAGGDPGKLIEIQAQYAFNMNELNEAYTKAEASNDENLKRIYTLRMRAEGIKVRTAFRIASLVQGGGTGGGRTISNQDFEVIYNSLFKDTGTPEAFVAAMAQVRHEMLKQKVSANAYLQFKEFGTAAVRDAENLALAYLDAQMASNFGVNKYDPKSFTLDIPEFTNFNIQASGMTGIFSTQSIPVQSGDGNTYTVKHIPPNLAPLKALGVQDSQINAIQKRQKQILEDRVITDEEIQQLSSAYAVSLVPFIVDTQTKDENIKTVNRNTVANGMKLFQFDDEFVEGVLNIYEQLGPNDIPHANYKQKTEETIPSGVGSLEQAEQSKKLKDRANNDKEFFNNLNIPVETVQTKSRPSVEGQEVLPFVQNLPVNIKDFFGIAPTFVPEGGFGTKFVDSVISSDFIQSFRPEVSEDIRALKGVSSAFYNKFPDFTSINSNNKEQAIEELIKFKNLFDKTTIANELNSQRGKDIYFKRAFKQILDAMSDQQRQEFFKEDK